MACHIVYCCAYCGFGFVTITYSAWTTGVIRSVMLDHKMLTIQHSPIPEWQWPAMQMDFMVKDDVDMNQFVGGQSIRFLIEKTAKGQYVVADVEQANTNTNNNSAEVAQ